MLPRETVKEDDMRRFALILALPLAACASVEERTDARSGTGFSSQTIRGAETQTAQRQVVEMQGLDALPMISVAGVAGDPQASALAALRAGDAEDGNWTTVAVGEASYAMRQARAGGYEFLLADPAARRGTLTQAVFTEAEVRTGCKTTGQSYELSGVYALPLDCS